MTKYETLKQAIKAQMDCNTELYNSIPLPSHEDPKNKKAEAILSQWRLGSEKLNKMIAELETLKQETHNKINKGHSAKVFVNGFGEATKRHITSTSYERVLKRNKKAVLSFMRKS